jgi:hypothetical protein
MKEADALIKELKVALEKRETEMSLISGENRAHLNRINMLEGELTQKSAYID